MERAHHGDARVTRARHGRVMTMSARIVIGWFPSLSCRFPWPSLAATNLEVQHVADHDEPIK